MKFQIKNKETKKS